MLSHQSLISNTLVDMYMKLHKRQGFDEKIYLLHVSLNISNTLVDMYMKLHKDQGFDDQKCTHEFKCL